MATLETIRRIRVEASERGLPQLGAALERYENTMEAIGVAMASTDKKTQSAARAFEAMQKRVDPLHREMAQLAREFTVMGRASEQGMGLAEQARNIELLFAKTTAGREQAARAAKEQADAEKAAADAAKELAAANALAAANRIKESEAITEALRKQRDMFRAANAPDAHVSQFRAIQAGRATGAGAVGGAVASEVKSLNDMSRSVAQLRAEFIPTAHAAKLLESQIRALDKAVSAKAIGKEEAGEIRQRAEDRLRKIQADHSGKLGQSLSQNTQLAYQFNDIVSGLAMGQSPLTILTQQGGQVYQAFADHPGGAAQGIKQFGKQILNFLTPARLAVGVLAALSAAAVAALSSFRGLERSTEAVMQGLGRGMGVGSEDFMQRMKVVAEQTGLSTREATKFGNELARTGQLGTQAIEDIVSASKDFAVTLGLDAEEMRTKLISAFKDPAQGIEMLRKEFNLTNAAQNQAVDSLLRQGKAQDAIRMAVAQARAESTKFRDLTVDMETVWDRVLNKMSNAFTTMGELIDKHVTKFDKWQQSLQTGPIEGLKPIFPGLAPKAPEHPVFGGFATSQDMGGGRGGMGVGLLAEAQKRGASATAQTNMELRQQADAVKLVIDQLNVGSKQYQDYVDMQKAITKAQETQNPHLISAVLNWEHVQEGLDKVNHAQKTYITDGERANQLRANDLAMEAAQTPLQKAAVEAERVRIENKGKLVKSTEAEAEAQHKVNVANQQMITQVDMMNQGVQRNIVEIQKEAAVMHLASGEREIALARIRAENELTQQGIPLQGQLAQKYVALKEALAAANQERSRANLQSELNFERDQMGRSSIDAAVASRLKGAGLAQDDAIKGQVLLNEQLALGKDLASDFGKGFAQDLLRGVDATEALTSALDRMASKLMDLAMDMAISSMFKGISGGLGLGSTTGGGGMSMGFASPTARAHTGGIIGKDVLSQRYVHPAYFDDAPRFHSGGMISSNEVPIIAKRGEGVFTPGQMAAMGGGSNVIVNPVIENHTDSKVSTEVTKGKNGEVNIKTLIQQAAAEGTSQPGNPLHQAVKTFGRGMPLTRR